MNQEKRLDDLFEQAKQLPTVHSFDEMKAKFLASSSATATKTPTVVPLKTIVIMLALTGITALAVWLFSGAPEARPTADKKIIATNPKMSPTEVIQSPETEIKTTQSYQIPSVLLTIPSMLQEEPAPAVMTALPEIGGETSPFIPELPLTSRIDAYQFPKLTPEEIAANHKRKKKMLKALDKRDNKVYSYVPSGTFDYNGKQTSVQGFYMGVTEVSNMEYRTFLFDLLINGRKEEFLKAKPDQSQWVVMFKGGMQAFQDLYFSHPAYDDYPVVNVSPEGAEMYCTWLTQELLKVVDEKKRASINDVRIPTRVEWVKAASSEGKQLPYPWNGPYVRNHQGLFQANFTRPAEPDSSGGGRYTGEFDILAPVKSYFPNALGLFNMAGNAAEMVVETGAEMHVYKTKDEAEQAVKAVFDMGTAGGSWRNTAEEIKILAPDSNKGNVVPKPTIGFRVVMTYVGVDVRLRN